MKKCLILFFTLFLVMGCKEKTSIIENPKYCTNESGFLSWESFSSKNSLEDYEEEGLKDRNLIKSIKGYYTDSKNGSYEQVWEKGLLKEEREYYRGYTNTKYTYDDKGLLVKYEYLDEDTSYSNNVSYSYEKEEGSITLKKNVDGNVVKILKQIKTEDGYIQEEKQMQGNDKVGYELYDLVPSYVKFNSDNNITEYKEGHWSVLHFNYDENGLVSSIEHNKQESYANNINKYREVPLYKKEYERNNGNVVKVIRTDFESEGNKQSITEYLEFDKHGNYTKKREGDKTFIREIIYEE